MNGNESRDPLVSIIIPTFNRPNLLREALCQCPSPDLHKF